LMPFEFPIFHTRIYGFFDHIIIYFPDVSIPVTSSFIT